MTLSLSCLQREHPPPPHIFYCHNLSPLTRTIETHTLCEVKAILVKQFGKTFFYTEQNLIFCPPRGPPEDLALPARLDGVEGVEQRVLHDAGEGAREAVVGKGERGHQRIPLLQIEVFHHSGGTQRCWQRWWGQQRRHSGGKVRACANRWSCCRASMSAGRLPERWLRVVGRWCGRWSTYLDSMIPYIPNLSFMTTCHPAKVPAGHLEMNDTWRCMDSNRARVWFRPPLSSSRAKENCHCVFFLQLYNLCCSCAMYFAVVLFLLQMC